MRYLVASGITILGLFVLGVVTGAVSLRSFERPFFTTTIAASTELIAFSKLPEQEASWNLPPGTFSILGDTNLESCESSQLETACVVPDNSRLVVNCAAQVTLQVAPDGAWSMTVTGTSVDGSEIRLLDGNDKELLRSTDYLSFSAEHGRPFRMPFVASQAQVGANLRESRTIDNVAYDYWQPILLDGHVQMSADNKPGREKYQVLSEKLDRGDVLQVGARDDRAEPASCPDNPDEAGLNDSRTIADPIWGLLTIGVVGPEIVASERDGDPEWPPEETAFFQVVLHTSVPTLQVTRFGAPDGHQIKASSWAVLQKRPNLQSAWIAFVSAILVFTFIVELSGVLRRSYEK